MPNKNSLENCTSSVNCVSSVSDNQKHNIAPISYNGSSEHAYETLLKVLNSMKNTDITEMEKNYIRAECKSNWLKLTAELEFLIDEQTKIIDVRSASRKGVPDFGANRKRVERIRQKFIQKV
ncbi:DUF1499 domain-containing protein [Pseudalkalibacillus salsuginis]|uniref:DUF1499 domain-containing protein n=1 Tax=Pseudalkalibacillus salsuginis TaxID=2910972 RepID=UPI001F312EEE|nr:DUF1499 domain-containing protein [Pseudalkalibacillus salsuginis]MCF6410854.1 DUF1499 domain-containing protein [Pseudalkalibacillus salsuginis]